MRLHLERTRNSPRRLELCEQNKATLVPCFDRAALSKRSPLSPGELWHTRYRMQLSLTSAPIASNGFSLLVPVSAKTCRSPHSMRLQAPLATRRATACAHPALWTRPSHALFAARTCRPRSAPHRPPQLHFCTSGTLAYVSQTRKAHRCKVTAYEQISAVCPYATGNAFRKHLIL